MAGREQPIPGRAGEARMTTQAAPRRLKQFVLKPTVFCFHRCPYCDLRQDYYREMVADRKRALPLVEGSGPRRRPNPGHMPLDLALRTIDEAAALGMEELQLSGGDPLLYPHLIDVIRAAVAAVEDYVNYISPVEGSKEVLIKSDPDIAKNILIFPTEDVLARAHVFRGLTADEVGFKKVLAYFEEATGATIQHTGSDSFEQQIVIDLPETYRRALISGSWDSTALLRANLAQVKKKAAQLPYMNSFSG